MRRLIALGTVLVLLGTLVDESVAQRRYRYSRCAAQVYLSPHVHPWTPAHQLPPTCYARSGYWSTRGCGPSYAPYSKPYRSPSITLQQRVKEAVKASQEQRPEPKPPGPPEPAAVTDITSTLEARGDFGRLIQAAQKAGVIDELNNPGPFTVFAPTDAAFEKLGQGRVDQLMADPARLRDLLFYHAVTEQLSVAEAVQLGQAETVLHQPVRFTQQGGDAFVNGARVIGKAVKCTNGLIYVIDQVLQPPVSEPTQVLPEIPE